LSGTAPVEAPRTGVLGFLGDAGGESRLWDRGDLALRAGGVIGAFVMDAPNEVRRELGRSGLVRGEVEGEMEGDIGVRSIGGRGERGTFHKLASSGRSSSKSSYSASISLIDFRLGCHEPRLTGRFFKFGEGPKPGLFGDPGLGIGLDDGYSVFGDGDRDRL